jgi:hypothetical protein
MPFMSSYREVSQVRERRPMTFGETRKRAHVEAVELGNPVLGDELRDGGIALGEPSKELGDTVRWVSCAAAW